MGKNGRYKTLYFRPKDRTLRKEPTADEIDKSLKLMSPLQLVAGINNLLRALEDKGVRIADYDAKARKLYKIQQVRGKYYFLASEEED